MFSGLSVAAVTPFNEDFSIDIESYSAHLAFLIEHGVEHLVICGTTGESPTFTDDEFRLLVDTAVKTANGKASVIAGSGSNDTEKTIRRSQIAEEVGANGLLVVTPYYNKPPQKSLIAHFTAVADSTHLPIILYNVPGRTAVNMLPETVVVLAQHPQIIGVKEASGNVEQLMKLIELLPDSFQVLSGDDALILPAIAAGAHGLISVVGNEVPALAKALVDACLTGDFVLARSIQRKISPIMEFNFVESNPIPVKAVLHRMGKMKNIVRLPLTPLDEMHQKHMESILVELGLV